jgi:hypothetical protein
MTATATALRGLLDWYAGTASALIRPAGGRLVS